jgi:tetratricopeptide (TPR) repeat protein
MSYGWKNLCHEKKFEREESNSVIVIVFFQSHLFYDSLFYRRFYMDLLKCSKNNVDSAKFCIVSGSALRIERNETSHSRIPIDREKSFPVLLSIFFIALVLVPALFITGGCDTPREYSEDAITWHEHGDHYLNTGDYENAIAAFSNAIAIEPKFKEAYKNRGNVYYYLKQYDKAADDYYMALEIDPEYPNPYSNIGNILIDEGKYEEAIRMHDKAISLDPDCGHYYWRRAVAKEKSAQEDYKKACELGVGHACDKY